MSSGGVLAVFAHPDDESFLAGGLLAACADAGLDAGVISLTRGERGGAGGLDGPPEDDLGVVREGELQAAGRALGLTRVECLQYPDGDLSGIDQAEAAHELQSRIALRRPDVVITFSAEGLYWHPDHLAVHGLARAALADAGDASLYGATWPKSRVRALIAAMAERGLATDLWGIDPEAFGVPDDAVTMVLDVRRFIDRKLRALGCHRSQLARAQLFHAIPDDLAEDFLGHEYLVRLVPGRAGDAWLADVVGGSVRCG